MFSHSHRSHKQRKVREIRHTCLHADRNAHGPALLTVVYAASVEVARRSGGTLGSKSLS